jgi:phosphoribosyl 1,2-cyclic phosphodiesterase
VRGTLPVPGDGSLRYGGNTSCVTMEFPRGQFFIFDGGSGIKALSDWLMAQNRRRIQAQIFISHPHWDHINALPFFVPLYVQGNSFEFYGASHGDLSTENLISAQMDGVYFPITIHEFGANVTFHDLREEELEVADIPIKTMLLSHPGYCLGYRIDYHGRSICYVTDNELFPADNEFHDPSYLSKLINFIQGTDVLITDSTYMDDEYETKIGWGHSRISEVADLAHEAGVKNLYLFHHDPDQTDDDIDAKLAAAKKILAEKNSKQFVMPQRQTLL